MHGLGETSPWSIPLLQTQTKVGGECGGGSSFWEGVLKTTFFAVTTSDACFEDRAHFPMFSLLSLSLNPPLFDSSDFKADPVPVKIRRRRYEDFLNSWLLFMCHISSIMLCWFIVKPVWNSHKYCQEGEEKLEK